MCAATRVPMVRRAQNWIQAVEKLAGDESAQVTCPACGQAVLVTSDDKELKHGRVQRNFECPTCKERGSVLLGGDNGFARKGATTAKDSAADTSTTAGKLRRLVVRVLKPLTRKNR